MERWFSRNNNFKTQKNMKKYIKPEIKVYELKPTQILAGSGSQNVVETEVIGGVGESQ